MEYTVLASSCPAATLYWSGNTYIPLGPCMPRPSCWLDTALRIAEEVRTRDQNSVVIIPVAGKTLSWSRLWPLPSVRGVVVASAVRLNYRLWRRIASSGGTLPSVASALLVPRRSQSGRALGIRRVFIIFAQRSEHCGQTSCRKARKGTLVSTERSLLGLRCHSMLSVLVVLLLIHLSWTWSTMLVPWSNFTTITPPVVMPPLFEPPLGPSVPDLRPAQLPLLIDEPNSRLLAHGEEEDEVSYFVRRRAQSTIASYYVGGNFRLVQGNLVGTINLPSSWTVQFDLFPTGDGVDWRSIVHLTTGGDGVPGGRLPGVWFCHVGVGATICPTMGLQIAIMNSGVSWESNIYVWTQQAIPFNDWSTVSITVDAVNLVMSASVSGAINLPARSTVFSTPNLNWWPNVQVFCSDPMVTEVKN